MSVLAIDAGTTGVTAVVVEDDGTIAATGYQEFAQHFPHPGWVEHAPEEIWQATLEATRAVLKKYDASRLRAVGITNQRETVLLWDRETLGSPRRAIVWQDRLALVGDAEGPELGPVVRREAGAGGLEGRLPDLLGGVLDPAGLGEVLRELLVAPGRDGALGGDHHRGDAGGAGVDGENTHRGVPDAVGAKRAARWGGVHGWTT